MEQIADIKTYTDGMKKGLLDKSYFLDKIDAQVIVDFGCADGTLLKFIRDTFPDEYHLIGYDIDSTMIKLAEKNGKGIIFTTSLDMVKDYLNAFRGKDLKTAVVLNSVIHEVYSYSNEKQVEEFWKFIFGGDFDYICIRDMMPNRGIERPADITDVSKVRAQADQNHLRQFEEIWGSITNNKQLIHFLLKYRYEKNWNREVHENYLPITTQQFLGLIPRNYCVDYYTEYLLPFIKTTVYNDFLVNIKDTTHVKIIIRKFTPYI